MYVGLCSVQLDFAEHITDPYAQSEFAVDMCVDVQQRMEKALGGLLESNMSIHEVRLVAPNKKMLCVSFHIPLDVAFAESRQVLKATCAHEQQSKRQRTLS